VRDFRELEFGRERTETMTLSKQLSMLCVFVVASDEDVEDLTHVPMTEERRKSRRTAGADKQ